MKRNESNCDLDLPALVPILSRGMYGRASAERAFEVFEVPKQNKETQQCLLGCMSN